MKVRLIVIPQRSVRLSNFWQAYTCMIKTLVTRPWILHMQRFHHHFQKTGTTLVYFPLQCFMIGLFKNRAPHPRYREIHVWDALTVLKYLATLTPLEQLSLKHPILKLIMLLLLDTGQRGQSIHLLNILMLWTAQIRHSHFNLHCTSHTKTNKPRCPGSPIVK